MRKSFLILSLLGISISSLFGIAGFGLSVNQSMFIVDEVVSPLIFEENTVGSFTHHGFQNGYGIGGYLYIDAIPVVDLDIEGNLIASPYKFSFNNVVDTVNSVSFGWASAAGYITAKKSLLKFAIPILAKAKLSAGAGLNFHSSIPLINQKMLEKVVLNGTIKDGTLDEDALIDYLKNNKISSTGFHFQLGLQFKLLMIDSFLYYRQVFAEDVIPDGKGFGSLNLRLGMGF